MFNENFTFAKILLTFFFEKMIKYSIYKRRYSLMKRVIFACIEKTLHFQLKEDMVHVSAAREVKEEVERYKQQLEQL